MDHWRSELREDLQRLDRDFQLRRLRVADPHGRFLRLDGRDLVNLAGNDYLGLSTHPRLIAAAALAAQHHGTGAGASRLVSGHSALHAQVEVQFAAFKHAESALICPTGYMANLAVLTALAGPGDLICVDKLDHASLIDAARVSGAQVRVFPHLNAGKLERLLERHAQGGTPDAVSQPPRRRHPPEGQRPPRRFIVTDSVFSMDGDMADLPALCDLAGRFDAILVVDEAHGTGVLGAGGGGLCEVQGVSHRVDVVVSTASKALGGLGGIVTARHEVVQTLVNHARSFIFTTAVPPPQVAAIGAALEVIRDEPERRQRLEHLSRWLRDKAAGLPWLMEPIPGGAVITPIVPLVVGTAACALALAAHLEAAGFYAPAIRPPTVAPGAARVRLTLRADLLDGDLERLLSALKDFSPTV